MPERIPSSQSSAFAQAERVLQAGRALPVRTVLRLQQTIGNREVVRLLMPRLPPPQATELRSSPAPATPVPPLQLRLAAAWGRLSRRLPEGKR
jgi:hypothetical protein